MCLFFVFFFSSRRRHTRCALVTGVQTCALPISPNDATPSAGYFTVHGGEEDVRLLSVISPEVLRVEMHESIDKNGVMTMQTIKGVDIPAQGKVTFAPGGKHLMIWGINAAAKTQGKMPFTLIFSNGEGYI